MAELMGLWKVPSPLPKSTLTLAVVELAVTTSSLPSPLKSPIATPQGPFERSPTSYLTAAAKDPSPLPSMHADIPEVMGLAMTRSGWLSSLKSPVAIVRASPRAEYSTAGRKLTLSNSPVLERLQRTLAPGRRLADGVPTARACESVADPGTAGHGKSPPGVGWSAVQWEDNDPSAQTGRTDAVGPVRGLLGGTTSPAALSIPERAASRGYRTSENGADGGPRNLKFFSQ